MARIDPQTIERILDAADIVEVVGDYVELRRRGANFMGLCPFHNERTPSFSVSRAKGICKCFSCGKGGNVVNFMMEIEQISYGEALRRLAKRYGIEIKDEELSDDERRRRQKREALSAALAFAAKFFADTYASVPGHARRFLDDNSLTPDAAKRYGAGLLPADRTALAEAARRAGFNPAILAEAGVTDAASLTPDSEGFVLPLESPYGRTVGFRIYSLDDSRTFSDVGPAPTSDVVFGYSVSRQEIARTQAATIADDPLTVVRLAGAGVTDCIAPLAGGQFTPATLALLTRAVKRVTLLVPRPLKSAGYAAMGQALRLLDASLRVMVAVAPKGVDGFRLPPEMTSAEIAELVGDGAIDMIMFKIENFLKIKSDPRLGSFVGPYFSDLMLTIGAVKDPISREVYIEECAARLSMSRDAVVKAVDGARAKAGFKTQ